MFVYEKKFSEYNNDDELLDELKLKFIKIFEKLESKEVKLQVYEKETIKNMTKKILESLTKKFDNVKKELGDVMGGKILDYEARQIKMEGIAEGEARGITKGSLETLFDVYADGHCTLDYVVSKSGFSQDEFLEKFEEWKETK